MDGLFRNKTGDYATTIESWMRAIIADGGIDRYDDLHIDRIDGKWKSADQWVLAGIRVYELALAIRDRNQFPFCVELAFSLRSGEEPKGINFRTRAELEAEFDRTPPSLYLLRPNQEPWLQTKESLVKAGIRDMVLEKIDPAILETAVRSKGCYYIEFKYEGEAEYSRSVLLAG
jgi:hypothetical protein